MDKFPCNRTCLGLRGEGRTILCADVRERNPTPKGGSARRYDDSPAGEGGNSGAPPRERGEDAKPRRGPRQGRGFQVKQGIGLPISGKEGDE